VYCASGVAEPIELALRSYRAQFDIDARVVRTGGSGQLFGQIKTEFESGVTRGADIFISADASLVERGHQQGVIAERIPIARHRPVIATHVDSGYTTAGLSQMVLSADALRFGIANESAAIGRLTRDIAQHEGVLNELLERRKLETENVMQLAQALQTKTVDAAVIWDATVTQVNRQYGGEVLKIATRTQMPTESDSGRVTLGVVMNTPHPTAALRVARFLAARDGGLLFLKHAGFEVVDGDR
jgi:ABC-type molybdate transport system substrate-binding protein